MDNVDNMKKMLEMLSNPEIAKKFAEFLNTTPQTPQKKKKGRPKKNEDVIDMTSEDTKDDVQVHEDVTVIDLTKNAAKSSKNKMCRRVAIGKPINTFVDNQVDAISDYEQFDKLVKRQPRKKSTRKPIKLKIRCRECKEIKIVDADIAAIRWDTEDRSNYLCDDCIPGRG